ncbi:MAG: hypothetical protein R2824_15585 [Saprospiraceae bacterium]|nr:hypothetical protein [Lewinella sp.]
MSVSNLPRTLLALVACLSFYTVQAQFEDYDTYDNTYQKSYAERLQEFDNNLQEARDYLQNQDDLARQARTHKKIDEGLQGFLETDFIQKFKELRLEMESLAASFKAYTENLRPEQVIKVKKAYFRVSDNCNKLLQDIKRDFLDRKKLKHIRDYPEMYSASLELRLRDLQEDYSQNFEKTIADITGTDSYSATPLMAIFGIIKFTIDFTNYLSRVRFENNKLKEEHLEMYFIEPFRFRTWEEIEAISANIYGEDPNTDQGDNGQSSYDSEPQHIEEAQSDSTRVINPFEDEVESLSPKNKPPQPKKKKNNN